MCYFREIMRHSEEKWDILGNYAMFCVSYTLFYK